MNKWAGLTLTGLWLIAGTINIFQKDRHPLFSLISLRPRSFCFSQYASPYSRKRVKTG